MEEMANVGHQDENVAHLTHTPELAPYLDVMFKVVQLFLRIRVDLTDPLLKVASFVLFNDSRVQIGVLRA